MSAVRLPSSEVRLISTPGGLSVQCLTLHRSVARLTPSNKSPAERRTTHWRHRTPLSVSTATDPRHLRRTYAAASDPSTSAAEIARRMEAWQEAVGAVQALGVEPDAADAAVVHAFGWGRQKFWQKEKVEETPDAARIAENVNYLRSVGFSDEDLRQLTSKFPEFLGSDCEGRLRPNVEYLQTSFFLKGPHCVKAIMRKPNVLGNVIACEGDCKGQCTRCWSQF